MSQMKSQDPEMFTTCPGYTMRKMIIPWNPSSPLPPSTQAFPTGPWEGSHQRKSKGSATPSQEVQLPFTASKDSQLCGDEIRVVPSLSLKDSGHFVSILNFLGLKEGEYFVSINYLVQNKPHG